MLLRIPRAGSRWFGGDAAAPDRRRWRALHDGFIEQS